MKLAVYRAETIKIEGMMKMREKGFETLLLKLAETEVCLKATLPEGRAKSLARTKLDECRLWAMDSITVEEYL